MASTMTVEWTHNGLLRIEVSAGVGQDLYDCIQYGARSPELGILAMMLEDRLDKPRRTDASTEAKPEPPVA